MKLKLAEGLALPIEAVTESIALLAKRRAGKSTTARRLTEQLHRAGQQVVVVDPKGDWWGLLFARDGKGPGLPFIVAGGEHGHVPIEASAGEVVARLVVVERVSLVLDLSRFRKHEVSTFMTAFLETLYRLKAQEQYRTPMMLVIDEADAIAPQKPQRGEERMLGAAEDIVRRGGQRGIGVTMATQRAAVLNKNVLTQIGILIVLKTMAPQDLAAMDLWIHAHGTDEQRARLMASLASLQVGTGWVWAPGWPDADGIFTFARFLLPDTFDSSKTPEAGKKPIEPKGAADVDLEAFTREMAATIHKAKADDPRELRKRLTEQDHEIRALKAARPQVVAAPPPPPGLREADRAALARALAKLAEAATVIRSQAEAITRLTDTATAATLAITRATVEIDRLRAADAPTERIPVIVGDGPMPSALRAALARPVPPADAGDALPVGERAILTAIAMYTEGVSRDQLGVLAGYKRSSRDAYLARLAQKGLVEPSSNGQVRASAAGVAALGDFTPLPTGAALLDWWRARLPKGERDVLEILIAKGGVPIDREVIDAATGFKRSSRDAYLARLSARRLVEPVGRGEVRASRELFD